MKQANLNKLVGADMKNCGLIGQIQKHIFELVMNRVKPESRTMKVQESTWNDIFYEMNWAVYLERNKVTPLDRAIKHDIMNYFDRLLEPLNGIKGVNEYIHWTLYLDAILSYLLYKSDEKANLPQFKLILRYYEFLRQIVKVRGYTSKLPLPFGTNPLVRYDSNRAFEERLERQEKAKQEAKINRKPCPKCGANNLSGASNIISKNKLRWLCNKCGKSYNK